MKVLCDSEALNKTLRIARHAVLSKSSTPIFSGFHLLAHGYQLEVVGMDLNMAISCSMEAQIEEEGSVVVNAAQLGNLLAKLPSGAVNLETAANGSLLVSFGQSEYRLLMMNEDDYPPFPSFSGTHSLTIDDVKLQELIKKTRFACAADESRPLFTGILLEVEGEKITFVGTNTHRLAIRTLPLAGGEDMSVIIPAKVLAEIAQVLGGAVPQLVKLDILDNQIMVCVGEIKIVSRLIEGRFPNYRAVIPPSFSITADLDIADLTAAVERVSLFSTENDYSIIRMHIEEGRLTLTSNNDANGGGREVLPAETAGGELKVAFNAKYVTDILKNLEGEKVRFSFNTSLKPVCVQELDLPDYTYIVTPVRVNFN